MNSLKRALILSSIVIVSVFVLSSCSTIKDELGLSSKSGVSYNGLSISEKTIDSDLKAIAKNEPLAELLKTASDPLVKDGKVTPTYRASWTNILMRTLEIKEMRQKHGMKITEKDREKALEDAKSLFQGQDEATTDAIWEAFPKDFQDRLVESFAEQYALLRAAPKVTDEEIKKYFDENQDTIAAPCDSGKTISHILVEKEKDAKAIKKELDAGGDFAKIAKDKSTDPGSKDKGGKLGCYEPGQYVDEFEAVAKDLAPGTISDVVKTDFGYHIIKAEVYKTPTLEEATADIKAQLEPAKQSKLFDEIQKNLKKAKVKVSSKYGRVEKKDGLPTIVPLEKDTPTTTSSPDTSAVPST